MNYYIQGDAANADKISAAFEKLGYDTSGHLFNAKSVLYFTLDGEIRATTCNCTPAIIKSHPDYNELELPVKPEFKVGDKVIYGGKERTITFMDDHFYDFDGGCAGCRIELQDKLLSPAPKPHYDISNFHAGMPVLVRETSLNAWQYVHFSHCYIGGDGLTRFNAGLVGFTQCIPFNEETKHLLGTTDMPSEEYINW